jgi:tryptophan synthase alpha chain
MAGYPDMAGSELLISAAIHSGVEVIEIGVPFSDPLADGPTIQRASEVSLKNGTHLESVFGLTARLKKKHPNVKFILFTYFNPILKLGLSSYVEKALGAGVSATLTVDLPPEESHQYRLLHKTSGLDTVFLASPTTSQERLPIIAEASTGFIYYVSRLGVTGSQTQLSSSIGSEIKRIRDITPKPIAIGFGISTPDQVLEASKSADGIVVGSHLLNLIEGSSDIHQARDKVCSFIESSLLRLI